MTIGLSDGEVSGFSYFSDDECYYGYPLLRTKIWEE